MTTHKLKIWSEYFDAVNDNKLRGCARRNDRDYKVGDRAQLKEWDTRTGSYTGRECKRRITYVLVGGKWGIDSAYVILSLALIDDNQT